MISARDLVSWYNGLPHDHKSIDLKEKRRAVIIGAGNVALDIARILTSPLEKLAPTDITQSAFDTLRQTNSIEHVSIVARRGVLNAAFTLKELRELSKIPGVVCRFDPRQFDEIRLGDIAARLPRPRRRITEYMASLAKESNSSSATKKKIIEFVFLRTPVEILGPETSSGDSGVKPSLTGVKFVSNRYDADFSRADLKLDSEEALGCLPVVEDKSAPAQIIPADLVVRSIGYKNVSIDSAIPFDKKCGVVPNKQGRVIGTDGLCPIFYFFYSDN